MIPRQHHQVQYLRALIATFTHTFEALPQHNCVCASQTSTKSFTAVLDAFKESADAGKALMRTTRAGPALLALLAIAAWRVTLANAQIITAANASKLLLRIEVRVFGSGHGRLAGCTAP